MAKRNNKHRLLVEGLDEQRLIPHLIERNGIIWGEQRSEAIVDIEEFNGIENLLKPGVIEVELKASGLRRLGILVDADENLSTRWTRVRERCIQTFPNLSENLDSGGLIAENESGLRLGIWIMPDNQSSGMLETFLRYLIPNTNGAVHQLAKSSAAKAAELGAPYSSHHVDKAEIHTWLAWQDPPGRQLHQAVIEKILAPNSYHAPPFVDWFRRLYDL